MSDARAALRAIVEAWESLDVGRRHSPRTVETWLVERMKPAIDAARAELAKPEDSVNAMIVKLLDDTRQLESAVEVILHRLEAYDSAWAESIRASLRSRPRDMDPFGPVDYLANIVYVHTQQENSAILWRRWFALEEEVRGTFRELALKLIVEWSTEELASRARTERGVS